MLLESDIYPEGIYELLLNVEMESWRATAGSDVLQYNVPKGSLLYLKNHTRGDAERVFEYVDGEQVFR